MSIDLKQSVALPKSRACLLTALLIAGCGWLSCLGIAGDLAGPFCWLPGGWSCNWPDMTGSLGAGGTPFWEEDGHGDLMTEIFI